MNWIVALTRLKEDGCFKYHWTSFWLQPYHLSLLIQDQWRQMETSVCICVNPMATVREWAKISCTATLVSKEGLKLTENEKKLITKWVVHVFIIGYHWHLITDNTISSWLIVIFISLFPAFLQTINPTLYIYPPFL